MGFWVGSHLQNSSAFFSASSSSCTSSSSFLPAPFIVSQCDWVCPICFRIECLDFWVGSRLRNSSSFYSTSSSSCALVACSLSASFLFPGMIECLSLETVRSCLCSECLAPRKPLASPFSVVACLRWLSRRGFKVLVQLLQYLPDHSLKSSLAPTTSSSLDELSHSLFTSFNCHRLLSLPLRDLSSSFSWCFSKTWSYSHHNAASPKPALTSGAFPPQPDNGNTGV